MQFLKNWCAARMPKDWMLCTSPKVLNIAAVGGSVTSGLTYGILKKNVGWMYHSQLKRMLEKQGTAVNIWNGGIPGTGPWLQYHCLTSRLKRPPDLAIVEYAVNTLPSELKVYEKLLEFLKRHTTVIALHAHYYGTRGAVFKRAERDMERIAKKHDIPVVSLEAAVSLGNYSIDYFMRDMRHPNIHGHSMMAEGLFALINASLRKDCVPSTRRAWLTNSSSCMFGQKLSRLKTINYAVKPYMKHKKFLIPNNKTAVGSIVINLRHYINFMIIGILKSYTFPNVTTTIKCSDGCHCGSSLNAHISARATINLPTLLKVTRNRASQKRCQIVFTPSPIIASIVLMQQMDWTAYHATKLMMDTIS